MLFLIEDEPDIRDSLREILESEGYEVRTAANGKEALEVLENLPNPGLILLDMLMPVMNGAEFLRAKENHPRLSQVPTVVLSADGPAARAGKVFRESLAASGASVHQFLRKPIDLDELLEIVKGAET